MNKPALNSARTLRLGHSSRAIAGELKNGSMKLPTAEPSKAPPTFPHRIIAATRFRIRELNWLALIRRAKTHHCPRPAMKIRSIYISISHLYLSSAGWASLAKLCPRPGPARSMSAAFDHDQQVLAQHRCENRSSIVAEDSKTPASRCRSTRWNQRFVLNHVVAARVVFTAKPNPWPAAQRSGSTPRAPTGPTRLVIWSLIFRSDRIGR